MEPSLKKPKMEVSDESSSDKSGKQSTQEDVEAIRALVVYRRKEVEQYTKKYEAAKTQLEEARAKLSHAEAQLLRMENQGQKGRDVSGNVSSDGTLIKVKTERMSPSPPQAEQSGSRAASQSKPQLLIPSATPKVGSSTRPVEGNKTLSTSGGRAAALSRSPSQFENPSSSKGDISAARSLNQLESRDLQEKRPKRKLEQKEHVDLISSVRGGSSNARPSPLRFQTGTLLSSQHKRKLRSLVMNPTSEQLFATSALDGTVNLWQLQGKGLSVALLSTSDCLSPGQRRWPEDMTWHPYGDSLFAAYNADSGDNQVSIINLNASKKRVTFLDEKPHVRGIVNSIIFMPWDDLCFATGGSDHAVIMWSEKEGGIGWKPKTLHRNLHTSAVMGVAGMQQKSIVLSAGADKRIVGFDLRFGRAEFKHQLDSKAMGVLPNPADFNLFMVQTGTPEKQLRLFDIRIRQTELHAFGWKQESSESQSALINQTWSPDGWYIASGSVDPRFHIFDIRYNRSEPLQSVPAHSKRVFKAAWHPSWPLVVSISSDLHIGLHKLMQ